jgi:thiol-disulfide isomerase/thioredoxin
MRALALIAALAAAVAAPAVARDPMPLHADPLNMLPPPFTDAQGRERSLEEWRGKVVLLNLWATWCAPCREEMPRLDALQARLGGPAFEVIALSIDGAGLPAVRQFYDELGIAHLALYNDATMRAGFAVGMIGLPTTVLVDREGREIARLIGPADWDSPDAIAFFESIVAAQGTER